MLLDSFMNGFIYELFLEKWRLYGRKLHIARSLLTLTLLTLTLALGFNLKTEPVITSTHMGLSVAILVLVAFILEEEVTPSSK